MLSSYSELLPKIEKEIQRLEGALTIEKLKAGMPQDGQLRYFYGFVPASAEEKLKKEAKLRGWALALDEPGDEDQPPTKVENNSLVRIIQPVFDFLGTVPGYREYDISKYFLIFFSLYFAMIFGDGGYGILMLLAAIVSIVANKKKAKPIPDFLKLVVVLSITTILWGLATGTWFALSFESLPGIMQSLAITAFAANNPDSGTNIKIFCFVIGVLQLSLAHIKNIKRDFPNPRFIAQLGSLALVIGMFNAVLNLVIDAERFPLQGWSLALIGSGFFLVLAFGNWTGKILSSLLEGLKGIIPTFLGTVSVFADIVSYIRLWAVALAGLAISQTLNGMVVKILGEPGGRIGSFIIGFFFSMVLLVVGHSLNFVMSVLSVVVHGIRLNMLEFSSHLGMEWTGYPYAPLKEQSGDNEDIGESR
jgi:V/A-type H+-transporting ATPase subunit I